MQFLNFEASEDGHGLVCLEAMASTSAAQHPAVMAEVAQVLDWAWQAFPHSHGPLDEGMDWQHELQQQVEAGGWHSVSLTLAGTPQFMAAFQAAFPNALLND